MFMFLKFNDSTITVENYRYPSDLYSVHGIVPTKELLTGGTESAVIYDQDVEYGFTDADTFNVNPNGTVDFSYIGEDGNPVEVTIFEEKK